jgi:ubiquinone/menaquinone biosynthesis C-methylase UbiE
MKNRRERHERVFKSLDRLNLSPGRTAIDLGCGTGITTIYMARQGVEVVGVDIADKLIEYAKKENSNKNTSYICADITELEIGKRFDIVAIVDVMEHIQPDLMMEFMAAINRLCHQRTLVYLNIPISGFTDWGRDRFDHQIIESAIPIATVLGFFDAAGLVPVSVESMGLGSPFEYYECVFATKEHATDVWEQVYNPNPASSDEEAPNGAQEGD